VTTVGVLGLQGDFAAHLAALSGAGIGARRVMRPCDLDGLGGLIIPGGESTTLLMLLEAGGFMDELVAFLRRGGALLGTCAGAILLARAVTHPAQPSLGLIDIEVERNAYGRQKESFEQAHGDLAPGGLEGGPGPAGAPPEHMEMIFIRAPRIRACGPSVKVLASREGEPVLVCQGRVMACTFHPELTRDRRVHRAFAALADRRSTAGAGS